MVAHNQLFSYADCGGICHLQSAANCDYYVIVLSSIDS